MYSLYIPRVKHAEATFQHRAHNRQEKDRRRRAWHDNKYSISTICFCTTAEWAQSAVCVHGMYVGISARFLPLSEQKNSFRAPTLAYQAHLV